MRTSRFSLYLAFSVLAVTMMAVGPALVSAELTIDIKPCYHCPSANPLDETGEVFECPNGWQSCGIAAINLCSKGKTAVAILGYENMENDFDPATAKVLFAGASPVRANPAIKDVNFDGQDDFVYHFVTRELKIDANNQRSTGEACLSIDADGDGELDEGEVKACSQVVVFRRGSCK